MIMALRRLAWPLKAVVALTAIGMVVLGVHLIHGPATYHVRLHSAAGLEAGAEVRVAGIKVGTVSAVGVDGVDAADGVRPDQVDVAFHLDADPAADGITSDSRAEVKLLSILGQRYLSLTPSSGPALADGGTIAASHALDAYTMDRFWLDSVPKVEALDLPELQRAVTVLSRSMAVDPARLHGALTGISDVARLVRTHRGRLDALLSATHAVTRLVLGQTRNVDTILAEGGRVLTTVYERRALLSELLREGHRFVTGLTTVVRAAAPQLEPGLRDLRSVLATLDAHRQQIDETLRLAGPTIRVFTNAAGDGPWLGVNAPYAIFPDDMVCSITPEKCS
jgi:phospholipid/cholesterol/gamma-HCH transport system substrate-binding protein